MPHACLGPAGPVLPGCNIPQQCHPEGYKQQGCRRRWDRNYSLPLYIHTKPVLVRYVEPDARTVCKRLWRVKDRYVCRQATKCLRLIAGLNEDSSSCIAAMHRYVVYLTFWSGSRRKAHKAVWLSVWRNTAPLIPKP